jgi:transcriptional regulator with XRE-family HTH domain
MKRATGAAEVSTNARKVERLADVLRVAAGDRTQLELAELLDTRQSRISYWLGGREIPSDRSLKRIALVLDLDGDYLRELALVERAKIARPRAERRTNEARLKSLEGRVGRIEASVEVLLDALVPDWRAKRRRRR